MEKNKQSSKALEETGIGNLKPNKKEEVLEKIIKNDEQSRGGSYCTVQNTSITVAEESKDSEFVLPSEQISENFQSNFSFSSEHLSEVPVEYTLQPLVSDDELKDQVRVTLKEHLIGNTGQSAHVETHNQIMLPDGPSKLSLSPTSIPDNISPRPSSALQERKLSPIENGNNPCLAEQDRQNSSNPKLLSAPKPKTSTDGYNWRKYGQKQVKSPEGSRSYYRCTFSDCNAKKIEFCDQFGNVIEIVYRNHHNHDPPQKVNFTRESRHTLSVVPANESDNAAHPLRAINDYSIEKPVMDMAQIPETNRQETTNSDEIVEIKAKEEHVNELEHKKGKQKKSVTGDMVTISKPGKKPKTVVEEAGDVGISGDGYRWRKYGQKMVKGNLHPRNYYRCTSAGCPVRKHTERATDSSSAVIISYTGEHDHDMPVPKKTRGPTSDSLIANASPGSTNNLKINETE